MQSTDRTESRSDKLFARYYDAMTRKAEDRWGRPMRTALLSELSGRVLEVGAGAGANLEYYTSASQLVAVEPSAEMRRQLGAARERAPIDVEISDASAERLPFPDDSFDAVVCTLVLCSVADLGRALDEIHRVLKPTGRLAFFEHIRSDGVVGVLQDLIAPVWRRIALGCHANRRILDALRRHGYQVEVQQTTRPWPRYPSNTPYVRGVALPRPRGGGHAR